MFSCHFEWSWAIFWVTYAFWVILEKIAILVRSPPWVGGGQASQSGVSFWLVSKMGFFDPNNGFRRSHMAPILLEYFLIVLNEPWKYESATPPPRCNFGDFFDFPTGNRLFEARIRVKYPGQKSVKYPCDKTKNMSGSISRRWRRLSCQNFREVLFYIHPTWIRALSCPFFSDVSS